MYNVYKDFIGTAHDAQELKFVSTYVQFRYGATEIPGQRFIFLLLFLFLGLFCLCFAYFLS